MLMIRSGFLFSSDSRNEELIFEGLLFLGKFDDSFAFQICGRKMNYLLHTLTNPWTAITAMCVFLTAFLVKGLPPIKQYLDLRKAMLDIEKTKLELEKLKKDNKYASKRVVAATFADVEKLAIPKLKDPNLRTYSTLEMPSPAQGINP